MIFKGVKNRLVFLDAADGGLLGVYDSGTGKKVFEDVAYDASIWNVSTEKSTAFDHLWVGQAEARFCRTSLCCESFSRRPPSALRTPVSATAG
jgi:hypothetical protein